MTSERESKVKTREERVRNSPKAPLCDWMNRDFKLFYTECENTNPNAVLRIVYYRIADTQIGFNLVVYGNQYIIQSVWSIDGGCGAYVNRKLIESLDYMTTYLLLHIDALDSIFNKQKQADKLRNEAKK